MPVPNGPLTKWGVYDHPSTIILVQDLCLSLTAPAAYLAELNRRVIG